MYVYDIFIWLAGKLFIIRKRAIFIANRYVSNIISCSFTPVTVSRGPSSYGATSSMMSQSRANPRRPQHVQMQESTAPQQRPNVSRSTAQPLLEEREEPLIAIGSSSRSSALTSNSGLQVQFWDDFILCCNFFHSFIFCSAKWQECRSQRYRNLGILINLGLGSVKTSGKYKKGLWGTGDRCNPAKTINVISFHIMVFNQ